MRFPCEIDQVRTLKKGMKIILAIDEEYVKETLKDIHNFMDRALIVDIKINSEIEQDKLYKITPDQRKKIFAIIKDIANSTGADKEYVREELTRKFIQGTGYSEFSLSNCDRQLASDFIEYLIEFAFEYGVELNEHPKKLFDDIEAYIRICNKRKICAICGRPAEIHHVDTIGMGHNRNKVDDSDKRKIALCRKHHTEAHQIGWKEFSEKHHVVGVV